MDDKALINQLEHVAQIMQERCALYAMSIHEFERGKGSAYFSCVKILESLLAEYKEKNSNTGHNMIV